MSKKARFLALIFEELGLHFGRVFGPFFERKIYRNGKSMLLAKTLKIVIFPRENAYFQEIQDKTQRTNKQKCIEKLDVFGTSILKAFSIDLGRVLGGQNLGLEAKNLPK